MLKSVYNGFYYFTSELLNLYGIKHLFSTIKDTERCEVSFSDNGGYPQAEVLKSFEKVSDFFKVSVSDIVKSKQIHEANVLDVDKTYCGMGVTRESIITNADGLITDEQRVPLCIFSADCVPVLIADKKNKVVCAVHSGWRGTAKTISVNALDKMINEYKVPKEDIVCAIGPAIGKCCFEVSADVIEALSHIENSEKYSYSKENGKYMLDLKGVNKQILLNYGIKEENIDVSDICTKCEEEYFYSYRRQGEKAGRNAAFIMK